MWIDESYRDARGRIVALVAELPVRERSAPVPACPGWRVHDVVAHLTGLVEDALAGRLAGPPDDEQTAAQVARHRDRPLDEVVDRWTELAPGFEQAIAAGGRWQAVVDAVSHEHDIRGAVGRPGARDSDGVRTVSDLLLRFDPPVPLAIQVEDAEVRLGGSAPDGLALRTSRWEVLRWRMGRRSRAQLVAMDWSGDPTPVLDQLVVFGPATADIIE